jgi:hypothetical protein
MDIRNAFKEWTCWSYTILEPLRWMLTLEPHDWIFACA